MSVGLRTDAPTLGATELLRTVLYMHVVHASGLGISRPENVERAKMKSGERRCCIECTEFAR